MPDSTVFVTGTNTEVGKTWLTARVAELLRAAGYAVSARKPVMSFDPADNVTDVDVLSSATGEPKGDICPIYRRYELPMAPPIAAEALGCPPFTIGELIADLSLPDSGVALVEGVGGPRSPLASDGDSVTFIDQLRPDHVVLVAHSRLGAINDVLTSRDALGTDPLVFLNYFDPADDLQVRNLSWLKEKEGLAVFTDPAAIAMRLAPTTTNNVDAQSLPVEVQ